MCVNEHPNVWDKQTPVFGDKHLSVGDEQTQTCALRLTQRWNNELECSCIWYIFKWIPKRN